MAKKTKYYQGYYKPENTEKYVGDTTQIYWRSSWELTVMKFFDKSKDILKWSSESIKINYMDPTTKKWRTYYPDFIIKYNKNGIEKTELIEVKPKSQSYPEFAKSKRDKDALILNEAKWKYARQWCEQNNISFRILTEKDIYL